MATVLLCTLSLRAQKPQSHTLVYAPGKSITLSLPDNLDINVAASGLRRVRFMAQAPDGRIFATGMYNLADNTRGSVVILDGWDPKSHTFTHVIHYLDHLRNPNNIAFWTDPATHQSWLYLPLTDKLVRYKYNPGDNAPSGPPQTLAHFPDYGLNYKYGGWHLTRTIAFAPLQGRTRLYLTAGSSCDYCREREVIRATLSVMDPDGSHWQILAHGLRNAVDMQYTPDLDGGALFATNMGDDHLGDRLPEDTFFELDSNDHPGPAAPPQCPAHTECKFLFRPTNYGWPACYFANGKPVLDRTPLPEMPAPGDLKTESERPKDAGVASHSRPTEDTDSVYGEQAGMAKQGTLLAASGGKTNIPDPDAKLGAVPPPLTSCNSVPAAYTTFAAHSSPLGLSFFGPANPTLHGTFLVALHGASHPRIGTGYRVVQFSPGDRTPRPFLTGFLTVAGKAVVHGRPCGILRVGPDSFLLTDDYLGLVYYVHPRGQ
ncbi:MAG TPA: hypothetical protein VMD97_04130 [Candidatus Aquilonibacter sp.]|nr:hypothetical protein [Candidatus Aquilonibacter sp.]